MPRDVVGDSCKAFLLGGACLAVYFIFGLSWISLPGPYYDEFLFVDAALPYGRDSHVPGMLKLFGWNIPSMVFVPYVGALKAWIWRALFLIWSPTIYSVRIPAVLLGGLALLLFYSFARRWYPARTALLALALASFDPSYIFTSRLDWGPVLLTHIFTFGGLLLGTMWYQGGNRLREDYAGTQHGSVGSPVSASPTSTRRSWLWLAGAGFCFGLGLWDRATLIWFLAASAVSLLVLFPRDVIRSLRPAAFVVFAVSFLMGALPLVIYNIQTGREGTAAVVRLEPWQQDVYTNKVRNLKFSLVGRSVYVMVADGATGPDGERPPGLASDTLDVLSAFNGPFGEAFFWLFCATATLAFFIADYRRKLLFPFLVAILMWVQMIISKNGGGSVHHFVLAYPLPHLGVAAVTCCLWQSANRWPKRILALVMAIVLLGELSWDASYLQLFRQSGGRRAWTDAIYEIADYVQQEKPSHLVALDWGFSNQLWLLTGGRVPFYEDYGAYNVGNLSKFLGEPGTMFLLHPKELEIFSGSRRWLEEIAPRQGANCQPVRNFFERGGRLVASILSCRMAQDSAGNGVSLPALRMEP